MLPLLLFTSTGSRNSSWRRALLGIGPRLGIILLDSLNQSHVQRHQSPQRDGHLLQSPILPLTRSLEAGRDRGATARAHVVYVSTLKSPGFLNSQQRLAFLQVHLDLHTSPTIPNWEGCYHHASVRVRRNMFMKDVSAPGDSQTPWKQGTTGSARLASLRIAFLDYTGALF